MSKLDDMDNCVPDSGICLKCCQPVPTLFDDCADTLLEHAAHLTHQVDKLSDFTCQLKGVAREHENRLDGIDVRLDGLDADIIRIDAKDTAQDARMDGIDSDIAIIEAKDNAQDQRLDGLDADITRIDAKDTAQDGHLNNLDAAITRIDAKDTAQDGEITNLKNSKVNRSGDTMTGDLNMSGKKVKNINSPTQDEDAANKKYVDDKVDALGTLLTYKGTKPTEADLPSSGNNVGDVWYVEDRHSGFAWVISTAFPQGHWEEFGPIIDLSPYFKNSDIAQTTGQNTAKVMSQKATSDAINDAITQAGTTADGKYIPKSDRVQASGNSTTNIMSQKATTDAITDATQIATAAKKGTVKPVTKTAEMTQDVGISADGKLYTKQGGGDTSYTLPIATETQLGGVKPLNKTAEMTQGVGVDGTGRLFTKPTGGQTYTLPVANQNQLGGVKPLNKTAEMTQDVGVSSDGRLYAKPKPLPYDFADPTAPPSKPITARQIAVYSTTNQTYAPDDIQGTLLVADPHSGMEAVNKRTLEGNYLKKSTINDTYARFSAYQKSNDTTTFHIMQKGGDNINEDRVPIYDGMSRLYGEGFFGTNRNKTTGINIRNTDDNILSVLINNIAKMIFMPNGINVSEDILMQGNNKISGIITPTLENDAANKGYVDTILSYHEYTDGPVHQNLFLFRTKQTERSNSLCILDYHFTRDAVPFDTEWASGWYESVIEITEPFKYAFTGIPAVISLKNNTKNTGVFIEGFSSDTTSTKLGNIAVARPRAGANAVTLGAYLIGSINFPY